jgi:hypothetical protein
MPAEPKNYMLGMDASLTVGGAELKEVKDVTLELSTGEVDITTRKSEGYRAIAAGLKECSCSFNVLFDPTGGAFATIQAAWESREPIPMSISGVITGQFCITGFTRNEPLEEAINYDVTAKLVKISA